MIIAKNDEEKRSRIWRITVVVSSVLIIVIAIYLLTKLFTSNPLEGNWKNEDGSLSMTIASDGEMTVHVPDLSENDEVDVKMDYIIDKDEKTISIHSDDEVIKKTAEESDGSYTKEMLTSAISPVVTTFDYSVESGTLTLTEREYGEQMIFLKK